MTKHLNRNQMAWRAAQDVADRSYVNLGIGIPVLVANYIPRERSVMLQSENGILGIGPAPSGGDIDPYFVDAGGQHVSLAHGGMLTDSVGAFTMITGGHIDVTLLGAFQVAYNGDFANWDAKLPNKGPLVGGAMDLAAGAREVRLIMAHTIAGFVTQFGGANSHMAIRAAELGIPAVIGAGERMFRQLSKASHVHLDCANRLVRVLG
jgi:3-oxoadipate CoA-transferase beta subunit